MFGLFKKKDPEIVVTDKVWMTESAKWNTCVQLLDETPNLIFIAWFEDSRKKLNALLEQHNYQNKVILYNQAQQTHAGSYVFIEHFPLNAKEANLFKQLGLQKVTILNSLDEPLFMQFGAENIVRILNSLGMESNEQIEHSLITSSIKRAQEKVAAQILVDQTATSQADWLRKNLK